MYIYSFNGIVFLLVGDLFAIFLFSIGMTTTIYEEGIEVVFRIILPFKLKILWSEIKSIKIDEYKPLKEFLGWGIRSNKEYNAYTVLAKNVLKLGANQREIF